MLAETPFADPRVPVVTNVDAAPAASGAAARDALVRQIDSPVRWVESVEWMIDEGGVEAFVEVGPGSVLLNTVKRIRPEAERIPLGGPDALAGLAGPPA